MRHWIKCLIFSILCIAGAQAPKTNLTTIVANQSWIRPNRYLLMEYTKGLFCNSHLKVVHVHWPNKCSYSYCNNILREFSECGLSQVVLRSKIQSSSSSLEKLKDDGILLYLVLILSDATQTVDLSFMRKKSAAKHLTNILLVILDAAAVSEKWLRCIFEMFWNMWILNVAIIYAEQEYHQIIIHRYDPFADELIQKTLEREQHAGLEQVFPRSMLNMRLRPFRVCMYPDEVRSIFQQNGQVTGADGMLTAYMAERLNATISVNYMGTYGNVSISHDLCFREIVDEIDHLGGNTRFLSLDSFYGRVEYTIVLDRDDLCVLVPKARIASAFWNLLRPFNCRVWSMIVVTKMLVYILCRLVYRHIFAGAKLMLHLLACVISSPHAHFIRPPLSSRIFLGVWLIFGLLISAAYKGNLTSHLVERVYLPDVNSLRQLAESPYPLATLPRHVKHMNRYLNEGNRYEHLLKSKIVTIPDMQLRNLVEDNNLSYAYLQKAHISVFRANSRKHSINGKPCYHAMAQCIVPFHAVYIVPYGSAFLGYINRLMRNAQEHGYLNYWNGLMSAAFKRARRNGLPQRQHDDGEPEVLQLLHFQAAFCLWAFGLVLAFIVFIWEVRKDLFISEQK
uniref:Uncharacterized protein n=1 Tax=Stomoxys calcitrans TaxID=35570 RepID=A0A1I8PE54_STOCA